MWWVIQGRVNGNTFLYYTGGNNNVTLIDVPGMSATQAWIQQREALQDLMEELRKMLFHQKAEIATNNSSFSLQGSMMCKEESKGRTSASLKFGWDGQIDLLLDPMNGNWIILNGKGELLKKALASDRDMTRRFNKTSAGDSMEWLKEVPCRQDEILSTQAPPGTNLSSPSVRDSEKGGAPHPTPTPGSVTVADTAASPNATATATGPSKANTSIISILSGIFIFVIIIGILGWGLYRRCCATKESQVV